MPNLGFPRLSEEKILGIVPVARWDPLSKIRFVEAVRQALAAAHLQAQEYADHSFRIGIVITAAMAELEDSTIQTLG